MTKEQYEEANRRCRRMTGVTAKHIFVLKINDDAERFEFTPSKNGFTSYTVGFDEAKTVEQAWEAVELAMNG